jgi:hypothetical protein
MKMEEVGISETRWHLTEQVGRVPTPWTSIREAFISNFGMHILLTCRQLCPRGLRHELFSSARTLGSWVQIPLKAWMSVFVY